MWGVDVLIERPSGDAIARRLIEICGPEFTRPSGAADEVAGAPSRWVAAPPDVEGVSAILRVAAEHDLSVVPRGAGTKIDWGATPSSSPVDIVLDTGRIAGIWHRPEDQLVVEVGAGTPVRSVQSVLERRGQRLALDVPSDGATIGGVIAADEAGPLRHRHGTPCDQLFGISYVDAAGVLTHAGGWSAGDNTASELARLLCGSHGALGVLVSATLRVQPLPASRIWVTRPLWTPLEVPNLVLDILAAQLSPAAVEVDLLAEEGAAPARRDAAGRPLAGTLAVLLEGGAADVADRVRRLGNLLDGQETTSAAPPPWWRRYPFGPDDVALRVDVPLPDLPAAVYALRDAVGEPVPIRGSAGLGTVHAVLPGKTSPHRVGAILAAVRNVLLARRGRCVVIAAPPAVRGSVDLWGDVPDLSLLRRVKQRFDPAQRLAPGRFVGGL
ncbi:FAD-binding oxidoreductase [Micromonospora sp. NPDC049559]|uniref:FAD-binding oxidoreductase n=1 Tax=Micromonospora sp. NPDC049559 TaxID=3155923 RepID=UPI0034325AE0